VDAALGDDANDGLSWRTALRTVGAALDLLDLTVGPAFVRVAEGTYVENIRIGTFTTLLGGHPTGGGGRDPQRAVTVLDGSAGDASTVEFLPAGEGRPSRLDGFTVTGGRAERGGGILVQGGFPVITNNLIQGNTAVAALFCGTARCVEPPPGWLWGWFDVPVYGCYGHGAGVAALGSAAVLTNNLIRDNAFVRGGDPWCMDAPPHEWLCDPPSIPDCDDRMLGAGIFVGDYGYGTAEVSLTARNNTVTQNAPGFGGAVFIGGVDGTVELEGNILAWNAGADFEDDRDVAVAGHNLILVTDEILDPANLREDPLFVGAGDYRLSHRAAGQAEESPAVDAGSVAAADLCFAPEPPECMDGYTTRTDGAPDQGPVDLGFHYPIPNRAPDFSGAVVAVPSGSCRIRLSWAPAVDPEGDHPITYRIYRAESPGAQDFGSPVAEVEEPALSWTDDAVEWGTTYWYVVRSADAAGREENNAAEVSAAAQDGEPPAFILLIPMQAGGCDVAVDFEVRDGCSGLASVELHRSVTPGFAPDASTLVATDPVAPHPDAVPANGIYYYRLVAADRAGNSGRGRQAEARVDECSGPVPLPGEAWIIRVSWEAGDLSFEIKPADGADFHRLFRGSLAALASGYDHGVGVGPDGIEDTDDDIGNCRIDGTFFTDPAGTGAGSFYYLVAGVNAVGEGIHGPDWLERPLRDATTGPRNCP